MSSDYYPYAVMFEESGQCRLVRGSGKTDNHAALLKRNNLLTRFEAQPRAFVMGRIRTYEEHEAVLIDTASDLFFGKTGVEKPLDDMREAKATAFKKALVAAAPPGWLVLLLTTGMGLRVPGVAAGHFGRLVRSAKHSQGKDAIVVLLNATRERTG